MKLLSRTDEMLLLTVWRLKDNAYGVTIRRYVSKVTSDDWSPGAIYDPLYRMESRGLVESHLSDPTNERGGRSKRFFKLTDKGMDVLKEHRKVLDNAWDGTSDVAFLKRVWNAH